MLNLNDYFFLLAMEYDYDLQILNFGWSENVNEEAKYKRTEVCNLPLIAMNFQKMMGTHEHPSPLLPNLCYLLNLEWLTNFKHISFWCPFLDAHLADTQIRHVYLGLCHVIFVYAQFSFSFCRWIWGWKTEFDDVEHNRAWSHDGKVHDPHVVEGIWTCQSLRFLPICLPTGRGQAMDEF